MRRGTARGVVGIATLLFASAAGAQDATDIQALLEEEVVTTASSTAQTATAAPALSRTITARDLRLYGIRTLADAIDFLSLGVITGDPLRTPDIGSRGVLFTRDEGKHFLLLVNGHAINDPLYGAARFDEGAGVPFDLVDRIEVIVGPGSVLYGSNAMMGVINVITKNAKDYEGVHVSGRYEPGSTWGAAGGAGATFELFGSPGEVTLGVDYHRRFGPDLPLGRQDFGPALANSLIHYDFGSGAQDVWGGTATRSRFAEVPAGLLRLRVGEVEVNLMASTYRRGIPYATATESIVFDSEDSYELDRSIRMDVRHDGTLSKLLQLTSRAYADGFDYQRYVTLPGQICLRPLLRCQYYDAGRARWIGLEEQLSLNWLHDRTLVTLLGFDVRGRWVSAKEDIRDPNTGVYLGPTFGRLDADSVLLAPYVQQTYSPATWLELNVGARLDADDRFSPVVSPRGAVAVTPFEKTTAKAIYSQAFRAPTWSETAFANYLVAPSDDVHPETVRSVEGTLEQRFGTQRIIFGIFRTWWSQLIQSGAIDPAELGRLQTTGRLPQVVGNEMTQYRNVASIDNHGWNGGLDGSLGAGRLRYGLNATAAFTRVRETNDPTLAAAPQIFGNARVAYAFDGYVPTPALAASFLGPREADRGTATGEALPSASPLARLRLTLTGLAGPTGLGYSASAEYATAESSPYTTGPTIPAMTYRDLDELVPAPERARTDQLRVFLALRFDLLDASSESEGGMK